MTEMSDVEATKALVEVLRQFNAIEKVLRSPLHGETFRDLANRADRLQKVLAVLPPSILDRLDPHSLRDVRAIYQAAKDRLEAAARIHSDSDSTLPSVLEQIDATLQRSIEVISPLLALHVIGSGHYEALIERGLADLRGELSRGLSRADEMLGSCQAATKETVDVTSQANRVLADLQASAALSALTKQAEPFQKAAETHSRRAKTFGLLALTALLLLLPAVVLGSVVHRLLPKPWAPDPTSAWDMLQWSAGRVLLFVVWSSLIVVLVRISLAHRHNAVVNRHRENALLSYRHLMAGAEEKSARDLILSYAAACVFGPQSTGFTKQGSPEPNMPASSAPALLLQVADAAAKHAGGGH